VVLACAAAIVLSLIARGSHLAAEEAFGHYVTTHDVPGTLKLLHRSRRLNPAYDVLIGEARLTKGQGVAILARAVRREPENWELWLRLSQQQIAAGDRPGAQRSYARARALFPRLPPQGPPPGM
jgi:predicted Zn-dependent protease